MKVDIFKEGNSTKIKLLESFTFIMPKVGIFTIPKGFISDGFSCPPFLWMIVSPAIDARTLESAVKHDFLYTYGWMYSISRWQADFFFFSDLIENQFPVSKAIITLLGVHFFGKSHFKKK